VTKTLVEAQKCSPILPVVQCTDVVKGLCCPEPVNSKDSPETKAYLEALDRVNAAHCTVGCPAVVCPSGHTTCQASAGSAARCVFGP
jgi:hypothetical protein